MGSTSQTPADTCRMLMSLHCLWATCLLCLSVINIDNTQANPIITDDDFLRAAYYEDMSPVVYNEDMEGSRLDKRSRQRQAGFSSWAGKRGGRNTQGFSAWAGKRGGRNTQGFNAWAGKRSGAAPVYHEPQYER